MDIRRSTAACSIRTRGTLAACALALSALGQPAFAAAIGPTAASVTAGDAFSASLTDSVDLNDAIGAIDLVVTFDPAKLSFVDAADAGLTQGWSITSNVDAPGEALISAAEPVLGPDLGGSGSIVRLDFVALSGASGPTKVSVETTPEALGAFEEYQLAPAVSFIETVTPRSIGPSVPAPGLACLAIPAIAFAVARRRSRSA